MSKIKLSKSKLKKFKKAKLVNLAERGLDNSDAIELAKVLKDNTNLVTLNLSSNEISDDGMNAILNVLYNSSTLRKLYIEDNPITFGLKKLIAENFCLTPTSKGFRKIIVGESTSVNPGGSNKYEGLNFSGNGYLAGEPKDVYTFKKPYPVWLNVAIRVHTGTKADKILKDWDYAISFGKTKSELCWLSDTVSLSDESSSATGSTSSSSSSSSSSCSDYISSTISSTPLPEKFSLSGETDLSTLTEL